MGMSNRQREEPQWDPKRKRVDDDDEDDDDDENDDNDDNAPSEDEHEEYLSMKMKARKLQSAKGAGRTNKLTKLLHQQ